MVFPPNLRINPRYLDPTFWESCHSAFQNGSAYSDDENLSEAKILGKPFPVVVLKRLFEDDEILKSVKSELLSLSFKHKSNDLYDYWASADLKSLKEKEYPNICKLRENLFADLFLSMVKGITGIKDLNNTIDMGGQIYEQGGHLLCHDDELEERRVAFILYLVDEEWSDSDGGQLDLFNHNGKGGDKQPSTVEDSILPCWNTLAFFEVTQTSYHQVREILANNRKRISITGWFHGTIPDHIKDVKTIPPSLPFESLRFGTMTGCEELNEQHWVNGNYLSKVARSSIREVMVSESTVDLKEFLDPQRYHQLLEALKGAKGILQGPPNLCKFEQMLMSEDGGVLRNFQSYLTSRTFHDYLVSLTNLEFSGEVYMSVSRFSDGCYTLIRDDCKEPLGLDVVFFFVPDHDLVQGGQMYYVDNEDTLLTMKPVPNSCIMVLRDEGIQRFLKYIERSHTEFFMISCIFPVS